jgi:hypothetical protein
MAHLSVEEKVKLLSQEAPGWIVVTIRAGGVDAVRARNAWCEANCGPRNSTWFARYLKFYFFASKHHALMFKLACGGKA